MELPNTHAHTYGIHTQAHTQKKKKEKVERLERLGKKMKKVGKPKNKKKVMGSQERKKERKIKDRTKREGGNEGEK